MKKNIRIQICLSLILMLVCSCTDFMDVHKEFVTDREIQYGPKVDSLAVYSGNNRIKIRAWLYNAVFVKELHVYWNNHQDSLSLPVNLKAGMDSVDIVIPNLKENAYTFDVLTLDDKDVWSLPTTGYGSAYGETFQSNITNRTIKSHVLNGSNGEINWNSADEKLYCTEVKYFKTDGSETIVVSSQEDTRTICEDIDTSKGFVYRSLFFPEPNSIDLFYTDWSDEIKFPSLIDRTGWEVIFATTEVAGSYAAAYILDGNMNSFWHSNWNVMPPFPYFIVIDMKKEITVNSIDIYRRLGNTDSKSFRVYVSKDNSDWKLGGTYSFNAPSMVCALESPIVGRYLQLEFFESNKSDRSCSIAEVYVLGTE